MWFRRRLDNFDVDWVVEDTFCKPLLPSHFPEPWTDHQWVDDCIVLPRDVCLFFADHRKMRNIERQEPGKINELRDSISTIGLTTPIIMTWDDTGKIRYHDGYHRLTAMRVLDNPLRIPVLLRHSDRVKGVGQQPEQYVPFLFGVVNDLGVNNVPC